ncbi:NTM1A methyltransferase, partial [Atractosteus spatula]|nr:NTM1A methyltransferase [Atractosteus spatula]
MLGIHANAARLPCSARELPRIIADAPTRAAPGGSGHRLADWGAPSSSGRRGVWFRKGLGCPAAAPPPRSRSCEPVWEMWLRNKSSRRDAVNGRIRAGVAWEGIGSCPARSGRDELSAALSLRVPTRLGLQFLGPFPDNPPSVRSETALGFVLAAVPGQLRTSPAVTAQTRRYVFDVKPVGSGRVHERERAVWGGVCVRIQLASPVLPQPGSSASLQLPPTPGVIALEGAHFLACLSPSSRSQGERSLGRAALPYGPLALTLGDLPLCTGTGGGGEPSAGGRTWGAALRSWPSSRALLGGRKQDYGGRSCGGHFRSERPNLAQACDQGGGAEGKGGPLRLGSGNVPEPVFSLGSPETVVPHQAGCPLRAPRTSRVGRGPVQAPEYEAGDPGRTPPAPPESHGLHELVRLFWFEELQNREIEVIIPGMTRALFTERAACLIWTVTDSRGRSEVALVNFTERPDQPRSGLAQIACVRTGRGRHVWTLPVLCAGAGGLDCTWPSPVSKLEKWEADRRPMYTWRRLCAQFCICVAFSAVLKESEARGSCGDLSHSLLPGEELSLGSWQVKKDEAQGGQGHMAPAVLQNSKIQCAGVRNKGAPRCASWIRNAVGTVCGRCGENRGASGPSSSDHPLSRVTVPELPTPFRCPGSSLPWESAHLSSPCLALAAVPPSSRNPLCRLVFPPPSLAAPRPALSNPLRSSSARMGDVVEDEVEFYTKAERYWQEVPPTVDGMLGGYGSISTIDINSSKKFLKRFLGESQGKTGTSCALDCGAGIGRITKRLLLPLFRAVDMVDVTPEFLEKARAYLGEEGKRVDNYYCCGLQDFQPQPGRYDVIWIQWVIELALFSATDSFQPFAELCCDILQPRTSKDASSVHLLPCNCSGSHLTDEHLVGFLRRCRGGLRVGGLIVVKDNVAHEGVILDEVDSSVCRDLPTLHGLIQQAGLQVLREERQEGFPKDIYPVQTLALR